MATLVGTQEKFSDALKALLELDYDAVEAYKAAINRLDNAHYRQKLAEFRTDHENHIKNLTQVFYLHNMEPPKGPSAKSWITQGKVLLANLIGDRTILMAMKSNELDTNAAYEKMNGRLDIWADAVAFIKQGLNDEIKHKAWLELELEKPEAKTIGTTDTTTSREKADETSTLQGKTSAFKDTLGEKVDKLRDKAFGTEHQAVVGKDQFYESGLRKDQPGLASRDTDLNRTASDTKMGTDSPTPESTHFDTSYGRTDLESPLVETEIDKDLEREDSEYHHHMKGTGTTGKVVKKPSHHEL